MEQNFLSNGDVLLVLFTIFVATGLGIDLGLIGHIKSLLGKLKSPNKYLEPNNKTNLKLERRIEPLRQAIIWSIVWISLAIIFSILILIGMGTEKFLEFITGYALEKSLSVDNMFVFLLIFSSLAIPYSYQHKVLSVGIISAISMRIPLILIGVSLLETFHFMVYIFGGLLLFTALRIFLQREENKIELEKNIAVRILKKIIPFNPELNGEKFFTRKNGILYASPMLVSLAIVEVSDLLFAVDSIPAVLAITTDSFVVITSNVFAILGLRSLYFLLAGVMDKFIYLKPSLIILLSFIGIKMISSDFLHISVELSLVVVFSVLGIAILASIIKPRMSKIDVTDTDGIIEKE